MKSIEIVTHAWAGRYTHYAYALDYQLSSLVLHPSKHLSSVVVCCNGEDKLVNDILRFFSSRLPLSVMIMELPELGRRSIGRNRAALNTSADIIWFTDCDHIFHEGCLDHVANVSWPDWAPMVFASRIMIHRDWMTGDVALAKAVRPKLLDIDPSEFIPMKYNRAIGGVQIVQGNYAREHGYLRDSPRWQSPYTGLRGFDSCTCDKAFRRFIQERPECNSIIPVNIPGLYRLRHTQTTHHD